MSYTITRDEAEDIADGCNAQLHADYSGRAMYGSTCVGFVVDDFGGSVIDLVFSAIEAFGGDIDRAHETFGAVRQDSMGRGTIYYFPDVTIDDNGEDDDE